jgi:adenylate cyclase
MKRFKDYKRTFKVDLLTCFIGLIIFTVVIVIYSYKINVKNTVVLAKELVDTTLNHAVSETRQHINIAQYTPNLNSILFSPRLNILNDKYLEEQVITVLKKSPFLFMYYLGDEKGNFILAYRNKYHSISTKLINNEAKIPFSLTRYRDEKNTVYQENRQLDFDYDPRTRPWYIGAKNMLNIYWTDIYPFFNKEPDHIYNQNENNKTVYGISVSAPILNNKKKFVGAIGVDISLIELSDFLRTLKIGQNGKALIVNNNRQLILFPWVTTEQLLSAHENKGMRVEDIEIDWLKEGTENFFKSYEKDFFYTYKGQDYFIKVHDFTKEIGKDWYLLIAVPVDDFLGEMKQARFISFLMTSLMLLLSIICSLILSRSLSRPIEIMTNTMKQVNELNFANLVHLTSPIREFQQMSNTLTSMAQGLKAFLQYIPPEVVKELVRNGQNVTLGGQEMNLTLFFSDIQGFTQIAEETAPIELMADLSHYFDQMVKVIVNYQGTVDKYIGDSVMAFWGAPQYIADHAKLACQAALDCQKEIAHLNAQRIAEGKAIFYTRIGLHTGMTIVGNIGSSDRFNYTVIGDSVNIASRLEGLNKIYHSSIIVGHATYRQVYQFFVFRPLDFIIVKGKNEGIKIYQLLAEKDQCDEITLDLVAKATVAFKYYLNKDFELAIQSYEQILQYHPDDKPAQVMIERCQKLIATPPDENWTGATRIFEK